MNTTLDESDIQGNIVRGYRRHFVRHLILEVNSRSAARSFLAAAVDGTDAEVPAITREAHGASKSEPWFNIGVTFEGLRALGIPEAELATFPTEFKDGMTARALKLGDFGESAPDKWPPPFDQPARVHVVASIHADDAEHLDRVQAQVARAFNLLGTRDGRNLAHGKVFFGYRDGISQPRFKDEGHRVLDPINARANEPYDPLGTVLLGYPTHFEGLVFKEPGPEGFGKNGTFNAFRILKQDAAGFEEYLDRAAKELLDHRDVDRLLPPGGEKRFGDGMDRTAALREIVAAQMCGRWRLGEGIPYALSPLTPFPDKPVTLTNYDYDLTSRCPAGAHMRRCNPRGGPIVQRIANYTRRLVRRGMSYGPDFDPEKRDKQERGLLGNFIGANLGAQFEAVMCDWLNLGLQDPDVTGSNDPLIGANASQTSWFDLKLDGEGAIRLREFPRFVTTRGGAYTFLPSLTAIRYLSRMTT